MANACSFKFQLAEIKWLSANGSKVACLLTFKASRPDAIMDTDSIDIYTVENGKIVEAYLYTQDNKMEDDFFGV